jgi:hypothetical protein
MTTESALQLSTSPQKWDDMHMVYYHNHREAIKKGTDGNESAVYYADYIIYPVTESLEDAVKRLIPSTSNEDIRLLRELAYKAKSDSLYLAWQKYLAKGDTRAETAKKTWIEKVIEIENRYKYLV